MKELPEVNFLVVDPQFYIDEQVKEYEDLTKRKLAVADPVYLLFKAISYGRAKNAIRTNDALRQQLLAYARGDKLDHKGSHWDTERIGGDSATTTIRFLLEEDRIGIAFVKKGTAVTPDGDLIFRTLYDSVASDEQGYLDVVAECDESGEIGNGFEPGEIQELINPIQYVKGCANITVSEGGTERESDEAYKMRIQSAPEKMSTAGSLEGYKYYAFKASPLITDVYPYTPEPGRVIVRALLAGGNIPGEEMLGKINDELSDQKVRPLTDHLEVVGPDVIKYDLTGRYFISKETPDVELAKIKIEQAISSFVEWQSEKMGRDINPSRLIEMCVSVGAKRLEIDSPSFEVIKGGQVAKIDNLNLEFGGVEDD